MKVKDRTPIAAVWSDLGFDYVPHGENKPAKVDAAARGVLEQRRGGYPRSASVRDKTTADMSDVARWADVVSEVLGELKNAPTPIARAVAAYELWITAMRFSDTAYAVIPGPEIDNGDDALIEAAMDGKLELDDVLSEGDGVIRARADLIDAVADELKAKKAARALRTAAIRLEVAVECTVPRFVHLDPHHRFERNMPTT